MSRHSELVVVLERLGAAQRALVLLANRLERHGIPFVPEAEEATAQARQDQEREALLIRSGVRLLDGILHDLGRATTKTLPSVPAQATDELARLRALAREAHDAAPDRKESIVWEIYESLRDGGGAVRSDGNTQQHRHAQGDRA